MVSIFCFGVVVTLTVVLGVIEAREFRRRERVAMAARSEQQGDRAAGEKVALRAVAGDSAF